MPGFGSVMHLRGMLARGADVVTYQGVTANGVLNQTAIVQTFDSGGPVQVRQTTLTVCAADFPAGFRNGHTIAVNGKSYRIDRVDEESEQDTVTDDDGNVAIELWLARAP